MVALSLFSVAAPAAQAASGSSSSSSSTLEYAGWIPYWATAKGTADASAHLSQMTEINPFGYTVKSDGTVYDAMNLSDSSWKNLFKEARSQDVKVVPTIMWSDGATIYSILSNPSARAKHIQSIVQAVKQNGFDGVDIDLENGVNPTYMAQALRSLSGKVGTKLIITLAPQTIDMQSTGAAYFSLALSIKDILTVVHTQYYNSGSMLGCDQNQAYTQVTVNFLTALACIQLQSQLRPDQVALGLPASSQAAGGGYQAPANVNAALDCLARGTNCGSFRPPATWPTIRGAMTWSINWDASNGYQFANTVKPHLATLP